MHAWQNTKIHHGPRNKISPLNNISIQTQSPRCIGTRTLRVGEVEMWNVGLWHSNPFRRLQVCHNLDLLLEVSN